MRTIDIVLLCMATWRLSHLIAAEAGLFDLIARWRIMMGARVSENEIWSAPTSWAKLWLCPLCLSIWIAPIMLLLYVNAPGWFYWVTLALAISGAASWLELMVRRQF